MISIVRNEEEYNNIILFLRGKDDSVNLDNHAKYRLKKKSNNFMLINDLLYLKDEEGLHKRVFHAEQVDIMELEAVKFHKTNHYGVNRFEDACNQIYFKIPRHIIRKLFPVVQPVNNPSL